jgi:colicin import membrane protein
VVEITSPSTRENDLGIKVKFYHRARVPLYVIADATEDADGGRRLELIAYRYRAAGYRKVKPDAQGRIPLGPLGLLLGVVRDVPTDCDRLACFDARTGEEVGDYTAVSQALAAAEARADAEADARSQAEARIRELEERLRRLGETS